MRQVGLAALLVLVSRIAWAAEGVADFDQFLFTIYASDCIGAPSKTSLMQSTGFRLVGRKGLYTTLHSVCGCSKISIASGGAIYRNVRIEAIDTQYDVAVLNSKALDSVIEGGFIASTSITEGSVGNAEGFLYHFPLNMGVPSDSRIRIPKHPFAELQALATGNIGNELRARGSPNPDLEFIRFFGDATFGSSGAPLVIDGKVVGITNGGLKSGSIGQSWAAPIDRLSLRSPTDPLVVGKYSQLAQKSCADLFAFEYVDGSQAPSKEPVELFCDALDQMIEEAATGFPRMKGFKIDDDMYVSRIKLPRSLDAALLVTEENAGYIKGSVFNRYTVERSFSEGTVDPNGMLQDEFPQTLVTLEALEAKRLVDEYTLLKELATRCLQSKGYVLTEDVTEDLDRTFKASDPNSSTQVLVVLMEWGERALVVIISNEQ